MITDDRILVCAESSPYIDTFRNTWRNTLYLYDNDSQGYNLMASEWVKVIEFGGTYYAVIVVSGRMLSSENTLSIRTSNGTKKFVFDRKYTYTYSGDPDIYGGMTIQPYLFKTYVPSITSISVTVGGSSGSTSVKVGEQKEIVVTATYDDGSTKTVTDSATFTRSNTSKISIV